DVEQGKRLLSAAKEAAAPVSLSQSLDDELFESMLLSWVTLNPEVAFLLAIFAEQNAISSGASANRISIIRKVLSRQTNKPVKNTPSDSTARPTAKKVKTIPAPFVNRNDNQPLETNARKEKSVYTGVQWLSHHIPKVIENTLLAEYQSLWGKDTIHPAYQNTGSAALTRGELLHVDGGVKIIHGHFSPHPNQKIYYPNARHAVWVRDPLERIWLLFNMIVEHKAPKSIYDELKRQYFDKGVKATDEIFDGFVKNPKWRKQIFAYENYFANIKFEEFDFVGLVSNFDKEFKIFSALATGYVQVPKQKFDSSIELPSYIANYRQMFESEYALIKEVLNRPR
ncbi:hypothetical protein, partial [Alteromonas sp. 14N.309.X.WAT.G.H12]|uniref:hypothetical protein n=1 Tax=Alteromonas sp. 14N.309.X.WAT.G.H12 TaxID=3120824 RepID=UPI002FCEC593